MRRPFPRTVARSWSYAEPVRAPAGAWQVLSAKGAAFIPAWGNAQGTIARNTMRAESPTHSCETVAMTRHHHESGFQPWILCFATNLGRCPRLG